MKKKSAPAPLPTHADEVDVLRLHNAALKMQDVQAKALAAEVEYAQQLAACERKYQFAHVKGEGINFATRQITRVKSDGG